MPTLDLGSVVGPQGIQGATGPQGAQGVQGPAGPGVPTGGAAGTCPVKQSSTDYDIAWENPSYYKSGDTLLLNGAILPGFKLSSGVVVAIVLPKYLPASLTINYTGLGVSWVRGYGVNSTGAITSVGRTTGNVLTIGIEITGTAIPDSQSVAVALAGSIAFN